MLHHHGGLVRNWGCPSGSLGFRSQGFQVFPDGQDCEGRSPFPRAQLSFYCASSILYICFFNISILLPCGKLSKNVILEERDFNLKYVSTPQLSA
jgi:hypothetical protein